MDQQIRKKLAVSLFQIASIRYRLLLTFMTKTDRLIAILLFLQSKKLVRAREIASHFNISIRTVYRDLKALEGAGVPLAAEAGDGYRLVDGYHLPPVMLTPDEASALFLGSRLAENLTDESLKLAVISARMKIISVLPSEQKSTLEKLSDSLAVLSPAGNAENSDLLSRFQFAILHHKTVEIRYLSVKADHPVTRITEPKGLVYYLNHWHLIAWCRLRAEYRDFRIDRIKTVTFQDDVFERNDGFSLRDFLKSRMKIDSAFEFSLKTDRKTARIFREKYTFGMISDSETEDGIVTFRYIVSDQAYLPGWLLGFGNRIYIDYPEELKSLLKDHIRLLQNHYGIS